MIKSNTRDRQIDRRNNTFELVVRRKREAALYG